MEKGNNRIMMMIIIIISYSQAIWQILQSQCIIIYIKILLDKRKL